MPYIHSSYTPLGYGWTLLISLPMAFAGDLVAQTFEVVILRREFASRQLPGALWTPCLALWGMLF